MLRYRPPTDYERVCSMPRLCFCFARNVITPCFKLMYVKYPKQVLKDQGSIDVLFQVKLSYVMYGFDKDILCIV
ncbi:unnamed protein product [Camellia sinensis]